MAKDYSDKLEVAPRLPSTPDLTGRRFDLLTVTKFAGYVDGRSAWHVKCACGNRFVRRASMLLNYHRRGERRHPQSCGCKRTNYAKQYGKSLYNTWNRLRGSGELCPAWEDFGVFARDLGNRGGKYLTKPDKTQPLGPGNFAWEDEYKHPGVTEAARSLNMTRSALYQRLRHYTPEVAMTLPSKRQQ